MLHELFFHRATKASGQRAGYLDALLQLFGTLHELEIVRGPDIWMRFSSYPDRFPAALVARCLF